MVATDIALEGVVAEDGSKGVVVDAGAPLGGGVVDEGRVLDEGSAAKLKLELASQVDSPSDAGDVDVGEQRVVDF